LIENITLATDEELKLWHSKDYIKTMKDASQGKAVSNLFRFMSGDNVNPSTKKLPQGIEEGARAVVKNSLLAIDYISEKLYLNFREGKVRERKCPKYRNN